MDTRKKSSDAEQVCQQDELEEVQVSAQEYYEMFNKLPLKAIIPQDELIKPGGVVFSDENIHTLPFGCNMVPLDDEDDKLHQELEFLKFDAELRNAKISLELGTHGASKNERNECAVCSETGKSMCQNCMSVAYCCRDHQLAHWKDHRPFCVLYEIVDNPTGRHCVRAKANIRKGEAIFIEESYLIAPFSTDEHFHLLKFRPVSNENQNISVGTYSVEEFEMNVCTFPTICIGCSSYLGTSNSNEVNYPLCDCGWPMCEKGCMEMARHRELECPYFKEKSIVHEECRKAAVLSPRIVGIVRALLLKQKDPNKWNMLFDESCQKLWMDKMQADWNSRLNAEYLLVVLKNSFKFETLQYLDLINILATIDLNGMYGCSFAQQGELCRRVICVFHTASMIGHRCVGNVFSILTSKGSLHVIAARNIKRGEELYRNHDSLGELQHITCRQDFALFRTGKPCECPLCVDPSAVDNSLSAIVCLKCKRRGFQNYMIVETPGKEYSSWKCLKCGASKSSYQVRNLLQDIKKDMEYFKPGESEKDFEYILRHNISKYKGVVLHREHSIILAAEFDLIFQMMSGDRIASLQPEEMAYLIHLLNTRINNLKKFVSDAHSSIVSMKLRLATAMVHQVHRRFTGDSKDMLHVFENLQLIHDDVAQSFIENTKPNALQGYILFCLRKIRGLIGDVANLFKEHRRRINQSMKYKCKPFNDLVKMSSSTGKQSKPEDLEDSRVEME